MLCCNCCLYSEDTLRKVSDFLAEIDKYPSVKNSKQTAIGNSSKQETPREQEKRLLELGINTQVISLIIIIGF